MLTLYMHIRSRSIIGESYRHEHEKESGQTEEDLLPIWWSQILPAADFRFLSKQNDFGMCVIYVIVRQIQWAKCFYNANWGDIVMAF